MNLAQFVENNFFIPYQSWVKLMHSGALQDNGRWELSNLRGLCQAGATYWTLRSMHFHLSQTQCDKILETFSYL